ncbi:MAG TPA: ribonuclease P protein component [Bacillota bacterium]
MVNLAILKKNSEFQNIFSQGHSINGRYMVVYFLKNQSENNRFGFCVGKKIGTAVIRNRIKRLLREAVRQSVVWEFSGWNLILIARQPITKASLNDLISEFNLLLSKAKLKQLSLEGKDSQ